MMEIGSGVEAAQSSKGWEGFTRFCLTLPNLIRFTDLNEYCTKIVAT